MFRKKIMKNRSEKAIDKICEDATKALQQGNIEHTLSILKHLLDVQKHNVSSAQALIKFIRKGDLPNENSVAILTEIFQAHYQHTETLVNMAFCLERLTNIDDLNKPPPNHPIFERIINALTEHSIKLKGTKDEAECVEALSSACRIAGLRFNKRAEENYNRLAELLPDKAWVHFNHGLFYKTRGQFEKGVTTNQKALDACDTNEDKEPYLWNLGICATGAKNGALALKIWTDMGNKLKPGRFALPEGRYPSCKVKLAEHPLAQRDEESDHPGIEETIWVERLSPCHGIIRSVLYNDIGVNYGDVILFDGAPITFHKYGENNIPVFPHLATLLKQEYQLYNFSATQEKSGAINALDRNFNNDVVIYSHTENYREICSTCWNDETIDHADHEQTENRNVVTGRIAAPPDINAADLLAQIDNVLKETPENRIFAPDLCMAGGLHDRAKIEKKRDNALRSGQIQS